MPRLLLFFAALLLALPAHAQWNRAETAHAVLQGDMPAADLRKLAFDLETVDALMRTFVDTSHKRMGAKADILLIDDIDTVRRVTGMRSFTGGVTLRLPLGETIIVARASSGEAFDVHRALYHEYAHAFTQRYLGDVLPGWFIEGFATYFETAEVREHGQVKYGEIPWGVFLELGDAGVPFAEVMSIAAETSDAPPPPKLYAQGWLLTHYMFARAKRADEIWRYIHAVSRGESVASLDSFFAGGTAGLDADVGSYFKALPPARTGAVLPVETIGVRPLRPGESRFVQWRLKDIAAWRLGVSAYGKAAQAKSAHDRYLTAKALLDAYPDEKDIAFTTARLALEGGEPAAAATIADQLLAKDPENAAMMAFRADTLSATPHDDPAKFAAAIARARDLLTRAAAIDPDSPAVAGALYRMHAANGEPVAETRRYLERAIELDPGDNALRTEAIDQAIRNRDARWAVQLLTPLANSPHQTAKRSWARGMIAQLNRMQPPVPVRAAPRRARKR